MWMGSASILNDPDRLWVAPEFDANAEIKYLIDSQLRSKNMTDKLFLKGSMGKQWIDFNKATSTPDLTAFRFDIGIMF